MPRHRHHHLNSNFNLLFVFLSLSLSLRGVSSNSIPEDLYSFPKFRVSFLNNLPVSNETAEAWLKDGYVPSEHVFLKRDDAAAAGGHDSSSTVTTTVTTTMTTGAGSKSTTTGARDEEGDYDAAEQPIVDDAQDPFSLSPVPLPPGNNLPIKVQHMRLGSSASYICLVPPGSNQKDEKDKEEQDIHPSKSWELLEPLAERCLYHKQGWFTYSYCHHKLVRQFRELPHSHPHPPGGRVPEEDPDWEAYTLGISPTPKSNTKVTTSATGDGDSDSRDEGDDHGNGSKADLTTPKYDLEEAARLNGVELATGAGQRYLVQRWKDGTDCKNTGKKREIEVQFHCSMTTTDSILFIKETVTCQYILVIHTPRLCGQPGFRSERDTLQETEIKCREVLSSLPSSSSSSSTTEQQQQHALVNMNPNKIPSRGRVIPDGPLPPKPILENNKLMASEDVKMEDLSGGKASGKTKDAADLLKAALEKLLKKAGEEIERKKKEKEKGAVGAGDKQTGGGRANAGGSGSESDSGSEAAAELKDSSAAGSLGDQGGNVFDRLTDLGALDGGGSMYEVEGLGLAGADGQEEQVVVVELDGDVDPDAILKQVRQKLKDMKMKEGKGAGSTGAGAGAKVKDKQKQTEEDKKKVKVKEEREAEPLAAGHDEL